MENKQIPVLNQKFDIRTLLIIVKQTFWFFILLFVLALISGLVFFRYTKPVFESSSIVQIKSENKSRQLFGIGSNLIEQELAPAIELIRSNEFLKTCVEDLDIDVSYFNMGTFLSTEMYETTPFTVEYRISNKSILDKKIYIDFNNSDNADIQYEIGSKVFRYSLNTDEWHSVYGMDIFISLNVSEGSKTSSNSTIKNEYYFTINKPETVLRNISSNLSIQTLNETAGTILISFTDYNARKAADITNTIAKNFIKFDENRKKESAKNILTYIDQQMDVVLEQLNESEKDLHNFRQENIVDYRANHISKNRELLVSSQMTELESNIFLLEIEIETLSKITEMIKDKVKPPNIYEMLALLPGQQSERFMSSMLNNIHNLERQRDELLFDVTANNHKILKLNAQIDSQKQMIADFVQSTTKRLERQKESIKKRLDDYHNRKMSDDSVYDEIEYAKLLRIHAIHEDFYSQLIKTKAETMISHAGYVSDNLLLERATVSTSPVYPDLPKTMIASFGIALFLIIIVLSVRYLFYNRINSTTEISDYSDIPIIGGIPLAKKDMPISKMIVFDRPKSMMAESFRNIRTNLEFYENKNEGKVITVSSTIAGEGKTFVAINTAAIFAMASKKVIIIDCDLRKPRIHKSFEIDNNIGVSSILIGKKTTQECIRNTQDKNLDFITSGPIPPNPAEIVLTEKFKNLIKDLCKIYDIVVIDTPPVGIVTDALASFKIADNPIYIMRAGVSPKSFIDNVNSFKSDNSIKNLGIILNGIGRTNVRFGYGYKTGYGYQYGYSGYGYGYGYLTKIHNSYYGEDVDDKLSIFERIKKILKLKSINKHYKYLDED